MKILNDRYWRGFREAFVSAEPFRHVVIDNFFTDEIVQQLVAEFPSYDAEGVWNAHYNNPIENKKACKYYYLQAFDFSRKDFSSTRNKII